MTDFSGFYVMGMTLIVTNVSKNTVKNVNNWSKVRNKVTGKTDELLCEVCKEQRREKADNTCEMFQTHILVVEVVSSL